MDKRTAAVFVCALLTAAFIICFAVNGAEGGYTMFVNDSPWYDQEHYPWEEIFGVDYLPLSMFSQLEGVSIRENTNLKNVLVSYGDKYVTFDLTSSTMYTSEGWQAEVSTYLLYVNERYVPAETICGYFGFIYEKKGEAVRVSDSSRSLTFNELLLEYNPSLAETEAPKTEPPVTTDSQTGETESEPVTENVGERSIYFTFVCGDRTGEVLDTLKAYGITACFCADAQYIAGNYDTLREILVRGHSVCVYGEYDGSSEDYFSSVYETGTLLARLLKFKTRLITSGLEGMNSLLSREDIIDVAGKLGYAITGFNCPMYYGENADAAVMISDATELIVENETVVFRFPCDGDTVRALPGILAYIERNPQFKTGLIGETLIPAS